MDDIFTKFYSIHIDEIHDFLDSDSDILYINGFSGSGKSSVLKSALKSYDKNILKFGHLCFKNSQINDFLLSFYDAFRQYAIDQVITLKKNPEEEFLQKVNFYFKNLEYPAIVYIDNYETVDTDSSITDLLVHISSFENVKVIIISKNPSCPLVENPTVSIERIFFEKIDSKQFNEAITPSFPKTDPEVLQALYLATEGYELYLKMALTYIESINMPIEDFMGEFVEKEIPFEDFIIEKQVSLIPSNYYPMLENLSCIYHNVTPEFIETYMLGDFKQIPYLLSKFAVSEFLGTYYIKSYLRRYFADNLSFQSVNSIYNKLIAIYENELKKSPKDRILRLSRETIRSMMSTLKEKLPSAAKVSATPAINYVAQVKSNNPHWFVTGGGTSSPRFEALKKAAKEKREEKAETSKTVVKTEPSVIETELLKVQKLEEEYQYKEAIDVLNEIKKLARTLKDKMAIYSKLATNSIKINDNNGALLNLRELCEFCIEAGDTDSFAKYRIEIGKIYKNMYAFSRAKSCFEEIISKKDKVSDKTLALSHLALGEIFELENDFESSIKEYRSSFDLILKSDGENGKLLPEICYKAAVVYDENGYLDEALKEYEDSLKYSETSGNEQYSLKCYTNCGVILADMGDSEQALSYLEYALAVSKDTGNHLDTYYIARNIAQIYKNVDYEKAYDYLTLALDYAKLSENSFEIAISLLELGDYYYDSKQNEQALICYFQAKTTLGNSASKENLERVTTRINDMKIKLGDFVFRAMKELYDPD